MYAPCGSICSLLSCKDLIDIRSKRLGLLRVSPQNRPLSNYIFNEFCSTETAIFDSLGSFNWDCMLCRHWFFVLLFHFQCLVDQHFFVINSSVLISSEVLRQWINNATGESCSSVSGCGEDLLTITTVCDCGKSLSCDRVSSSLPATTVSRGRQATPCSAFCCSD